MLQGAERWPNTNKGFHHYHQQEKQKKSQYWMFSVSSRTSTSPSNTSALLYYGAHHLQTSSVLAPVAAGNCRAVWTASSNSAALTPMPMSKIKTQNQVAWKMCQNWVWVTDQPNYSWRMWKRHHSVFLLLSGQAGLYFWKSFQVSLSYFAWQG